MNNFTDIILVENVLGATSLYADDLDGDNNIDIISANTEENKIVWYQNNGSQVFTNNFEATINAPRSVSVIDVDGDGKVTAFGDGLMIIRKLLGAAFAGEALTSKAISNDATRSSDEIHDYIAAMTTVDPIS